MLAAGKIELRFAAASTHVRGSKMLIDTLMPSYHFRGLMAITIHATAEQIFQALEQVKLADMPIARFLITVRYLPARIFSQSAAETSSEKPIIQAVLDYWLLLAESTAQEIVVGTTAKLHHILSDQESAPIYNLAEFQAFAIPGFQKYVLSFQINGGSLEEGYSVRVDHRIFAFGKEARRKFFIYWLWIKPFSALLLTILLHAVKRIAEQERQADKRLQAEKAL